MQIVKIGKKYAVRKRRFFGLGRWVYRDWMPVSNSDQWILKNNRFFRDCLTNDLEKCREFLINGEKIEVIDEV